MAFSHGTPNSIVTDELVFCVDPANKVSWSGPDSATVNDFIGTNIGTIYNDTSGSYGDNNSFAFDGATDYITLYDGTIGALPSAFSIGASDSYSIAFWFKSNKGGAPNTAYTQRNISAGSVFNRFSFSYVGSSDTYRVTYAIRDNENTQASEVSDSTNLVIRNQWNYIVGVLDRSADKLFVYVNKVVTGTGTGASSIGAMTDITDVSLGRDPYGGGRSYLQGQIGPIQIYNKALSQSEITQNYNALKNRFRT